MIKIGITGHRKLKSEYLSFYKEKVFTQLKYLQNKYNQIVVLSPLADGADRLVAL